ncbi:TadG family pilus assembly protein [Aliihoeflea sp. PC F10.4]
MITAIVSPVLIIVAALGVDTGSFFLERREAQGLTDLAAMSAARSPQNAEKIALEVFADNGFAVPADIGNATYVRATKGVYTPNPAIAPGRRFVAGKEPANAVQVEYQRKAARFFSGSLIEAPTIRTVAVASMEPRATFSIGSRLAALDGGIANQILSSLLGTSIKLTAMDYNALLSTNIDLLAFAEQAGVSANLKAGTYRDVLDAQISARHAVQALAATPGLGLVAKSALQSVASAIPATRKLKLGDIVDLGTDAGARVGGITAGLATDVNGMAMLRALAALANDQNQVAVNLGAGIPGIANAIVTLAIGEPPKFSIHGPVGTSMRTAQTRLRVDLQIGTSNPLLTAMVHVPVYIDVAYGTGTISSIACPTGLKESARVVIATRPGIVVAHIADFDVRNMHDFSRQPKLERATLVGLRVAGIHLANVSARATANATNHRDTPLAFIWPDIEHGKVKTAATRDAVSTLTSSLLSNLELRVEPLGIPLLSIPSGALGEVTKVLNPVAPALDQILNTVLAITGVSLGEADVRVHRVDCGRPALVQ